MQIEFNSQGYIDGKKPEYDKPVKKRLNTIPSLKKPKSYNKSVLKVTKKPNVLWRGIKQYQEECKRTELIK